MERLGHDNTYHFLSLKRIYFIESAKDFFLSIEVHFVIINFLNHRVGKSYGEDESSRKIIPGIFSELACIS